MSDDAVGIADGYTTATVVFSEAVTGLTVSDFNIVNTTVSNLQTSDNITYTVRLTPAVDGNFTLSLPGGSANDAAGNGNLASNTVHFIADTTQPVAIVTIDDNELRAGETTTATFYFSEAVTGFTTADVSVANGSLSNLASSDGGVIWTATFTPAPGVVDTTNQLSLNMLGVADVAGNVGVGTANSPNYTVQTVRPTATLVVGDHALAANETTSVTVTFSEAVSGLTTADLHVDNGTLSGLATGDGGITWTATLTPDDGVSDTTNLVVLDTAGVINAAGNAGVGTTASNNYVIDTAPPTATITVVDPLLGAGETSSVTIAFSEAVTGFSNADLTVEHGSLSAVTSSDGGVTWTATFTPDANLTDSTNTITLDNTGVADAAGNDGVGATASNNYAIATSVPPPPPATPTDFFGTAAPDRIIGNALDNVINVGDGADTVMAGDGADTVLGGAGPDLLQGNTGADSLAGGAGTDTILGGQDDDFLQGNAGDDRLSGDKGNDVVFGGQDNDTVQGGEGDDFVAGDRGDDVVLGGQGDDVVLGGDGDDVLSGDRGADTLTGGAGADVFHSFGDAGLDLITDFNRAEGDRLQLDPGTAYTFGQSGADVVVSLAGGARIVLADVQLSSLTEGWISA